MKVKFILGLCSAISLFSSAYGQTHVTTGTQKYTLLEEGTGTWCGYCPDGAQRIQQTVEPTYPRCISVSFHNGDPMALAGDPFNGAYITSFPGGSIDRVPFTHPNSSGVPTTAVNVNRGYWSTDVGVENGLTPNFQIDMLGLYDSVTRVVTVTVTAKALVALTGDYRINAYITEDSISSASGSYQQHSYLFSSSGSYFNGQSIGSCGSGCWILPDSIYAHMNVVRSMLAAGGSMWGDAAFMNPVVGTTVSKTYTYTIPSTSPSKYIKVVGLVQKYGATTDDRAIQNSVRAKVRTMWKSVVAVGSLSKAMDEVELYPNPAADMIHVAGTLSEPTETKIIICNTIGQTVLEKVYPAGGSAFSENVSLNNLSSGIYFMSIVNNGEKITKRFTITK